MSSLFFRKLIAVLYERKQTMFWIFGGIIMTANVTLTSETMKEFRALAYGWGIDLADMCDYYGREGIAGGWGHEACKAMRWEPNESTYNRLFDTLIRQGYSEGELNEIWKEERQKGIQWYETDFQIWKEEQDASWEAFNREREA